MLESLEEQQNIEEQDPSLPENGPDSFVAKIHGVIRAYKKRNKGIDRTSQTSLRR